MNVTTRLNRLEKPNAYPLRILKMYQTMTAMPDEAGEAWYAKLTGPDLLAIYKMMITANILHQGRDATRAEMEATSDYDAQWMDWLMDGVIEEKDIAARHAQAYVGRQETVEW